jgi:2-(1,2-epoxy-1,2-dihydrophenyl)acetyl-CoA isomerase
VSSEAAAPSPPAATVELSRLLNGQLAVLTLSRPEVKNAVGPVEWQALCQHLQTLAGDPTVRVLLLTGAGDAFCAGGDLRSMPERLALSPASRRAQLDRDSQVIQKLYEFERPVVARIAGPCLGAGLSLALACDLRIAARTASFGAVFHRVGLTGDFGLTWLLPRVVGPARATQLLLEAEVIDGERAAAIELVHRVVDPGALEAETLSLCQRLCQGPPLAQAMTKRGLRRSAALALDAMLDWEAQAQSILSKTDDALEGVQAFVQKRRPVFRGA